MVLVKGSYEWFRDVVGLSGTGIVLRDTKQHLYGGVTLKCTLTEEHASIEQVNNFLGVLKSHNGYRFRDHKNLALRNYLMDLFRRVYQVDDNVNHDFGRVFARGVFAEVMGNEKVNWAAFAVVSCHWKGKKFVPHPIWATATAAPVDSIEVLLQECRNSCGINKVCM